MNIREIAEWIGAIITVITLAWLVTKALIGFLDWWDKRP